MSQRLNDSRIQSVSVLLNHHLGRFHHREHRVALLEFQFISAAASDRALDEILADAYDYMRHHVAKMNLFYLSLQFVSG